MMYMYNYVGLLLEIKTLKKNSDMLIALRISNLTLEFIFLKVDNKALF